jgi:trigger factor
MFGKSVREELARDLVQETFQTAVANHNTIALTQPVVEQSSLEKNRPFVYAARFEVPPNLQPENYRGVAVRRRPAQVHDDKVETELQTKREQLTELRPVPVEAHDHVTEPGDVWTVDVEGQLGELPLSRTDLKVEIGKHTQEFVPGLAAALEGIKRSEVGTVKNLRFVPPADRVKPEYRGGEAVLAVGLRDVRVKHVPDLDDEFARDTGEAETLDELRQKLRERLLEDDRNQAEREARLRLVEELLSRHPFEPAPSMVGREVAAQIDLAKRQLGSQGLTLAQAGTSEAQLARQIRPQALFNVKAFLLLDAIAKAEGIDVPDDEFERELQTMAQESGQSMARMRATMEKNGQLILLRAQMREEKILDFLMAQADVTEAPDPGLDEQIEQAAAKAAGAGSTATATGSRRRKRKSKAKTPTEADAEVAGDASVEVTSSTAGDEQPTENDTER